MKNIRLKAMLMTICALLLSMGVTAQTTYHVYSDDIPWLSTPVEQETGKIYSINEAISQASAGDIILIHEGVYREKVSVTKNNLTLQNYESDYVLISGAEIVTGWSDASGMTSGVQQADISSFNIETDYTQFFANGIAQVMARHPNNTSGDMMDPLGDNSGFALLSNVYKDVGTNANGYATLEGESLPNVDLTGGIFRGMTGKLRNFVYGDVTNSSGNTVTFKAINDNVWQDNAAIPNDQYGCSWGFVMHKNLIDYPGEWFADGNTIYFLPPSGQSIAEMRIEIQVRERVLVLNNTSGVTIKGVNFVAGNADMQNTDNATIDECSMRYLYPFWVPTGYGQSVTDKTGVYLNNSSDNTFKDTYVAHSWGNMFALFDGANNSFENCIIEDLGWVGVFSSAIHINESDNTNIDKCTFGDAARFQVRIDGGSAKVNIRDCDFYGSMKMGEDAGPIEATSTGWIGALNMNGSEIAYNKIHDVHGIPASDASYNKQKVTAMYMEDTENYTAHHNLIYDIKADNYNGSVSIKETGEFLYLGPRYNEMTRPVNFYNNTIWNVDFHIGIWNIVINNWEDLGLSHSQGSMEDGHFANNIFMNGPNYKVQFDGQNISSTGAKVSSVTLSPRPLLETDDFNEFVDYCDDYNFMFNPENNSFFNESTASTHFADATNGDFTLNSGSAAIGSGTSISGITSSSNPDCGALEGSARVLDAGSTLTEPTFMEEGEAPPVSESVAFVNLPDNMLVSELLTFTVNYVATADRDLYIVLKDVDGTWLESSSFVVNEGSGSKTATLDSPGTLGNYIAFSSLREVGGDNTAAVATVEEDIELTDEQTFVDDIVFTNFNSSVATSETLTFTVDYEASVERDLLVVLKDQSDAWIGSTRYAVPQGSGSETVTITMDVAPAIASYTAMAALREVGGDYTTTAASDDQAIELTDAITTFYIVNKSTGKKVSQVGSVDGEALEQVPASSTSDFAKWTKVETDNDYFYLQNEGSEMYFRPTDDSDGSVLIQRPTSYDGDYTQWVQITSSGDYFYLQNRSTGMYFRPDTDDDNSPIVQRPTSWSGDYTQWMFVDASSGEALNVAQISTDISSGVKAKDIVIYPNPVLTESFTVETGTVEETITVCIYDIQGKQIYNMTSNTSKTEVPVSLLVPGIYIVKVKTEGTVTTKKLKVK